MPAPSALAALLVALVNRRVAPPAAAWLAQATGADTVGDRSAFLDAFATAARRLGTAPLALEPAERAALPAGGVGCAIDGWTVDEIGRAALLLSAAARCADAEHAALVEACYRQGDNRERQAVLRALPLLPGAECFLPLALDACRSNVRPIFEAIACENPYPAAHFPGPSFNQMVLKALFTGVALVRILGLEERVTPELTRMANDYASERRAAGRSVPEDLWRVTAGRQSEP